MGQVGHTGYVTALVYVAPGASRWYPEGAVISGEPLSKMAYLRPTTLLMDE